MPKILKPKLAIHLPRVKQETDSYCGPAVIQALLAHVHKTVTQDQIVAATGAKTTIKRYGTRPQELAKAVAKLAPHYQFWFKQDATTHDLVLLVKKYHWPIAVDWQGLFYETAAEEAKNNPHGDYGHYSTVIGIDTLKRKITLADPYPDFASQPRTFSLSWFKKRWWDISRRKDQKTGRENVMKTHHLIFVVTPQNVGFPQKLHMLPSQKLAELNK